jgi:ribonucleoside-diphosphate reductase alpha chain
MNGGMMVVRRTGEVVDFDANRIKSAISKAVSATQTDLPPGAVDEITSEITTEVQRRFTDFYPNVENIQDLVEKHLVQKGLYEVAKGYILYRAKRHDQREEEKQQNVRKSLLGKLRVRKRDGATVIFDIMKLNASIARSSRTLGDAVSVELVSKEALKNVYDGISTDELEKTLILSSISFIERDPAYSYLSANLFLQKLYKEVIGRSIKDEEMEAAYRTAFAKGILAGVDEGTLDKRMLDFDLDKMAGGLVPGRDALFQYIGIQTLYERYFFSVAGKRAELPQSFWMRVAMGLSLNEKHKEAKALEFYDAISLMRFVPSTPTLFHSGTARPQLSSCYLTTVSDDLTDIFKSFGDNAQLSKWSGGLGNDWSNIRATGSWIKSTKVESQGVIPFLKIANDVTVAINRSGKRRGATCAYLETWHLDIEDFLDLRRNTGDERRRTHDMNTANWIPDLFMKRVAADETWTLFSPEEVPDLHHIYGSKFESQYLGYEEKARNGQIKKHKVLSARQLWRKMLTRLFETGHPWVTFKDPCNIRSPQDHAGVVHSSNLCTEITLNTSAEETAVCNLGSINLSRHLDGSKLDRELLAATTKTGMRMLDNVIDVNYYPTPEAKVSNMRHRPVGLGIMGFQDSLYAMDLSFDSPAAIEFSDNMMEFIAYHAILASSELAKERGTYESYQGSKWDRGLFPLDTLQLLEEERGMKVEVNRNESLDWTPVRESVRKHGMRNSNTMAIAPTATISNIAGCLPSIEPIYKNIYVKANISGEFTIVNSGLVEDLKGMGLWNTEMLEQLKYYDGSIQLIPGVPKELKEKYKEAFEVESECLIKHAAVRGKWIDQSQSLNIFMGGATGKALDDTYFAAWHAGLKTTYYLRTLAASQIEKSTLDTKYGFTQKREYATVAQDAGATALASAQVAVDVAASRRAPMMAMEGAGRTTVMEGAVSRPVVQPAVEQGQAAPEFRAPNALEMAAKKLAAEGKFDPAAKNAGLVCVGDPECEACQ